MTITDRDSTIEQSELALADVQGYLLYSGLLRLAETLIVAYPKQGAQVPNLSEVLSSSASSPTVR